jgi:hypothetical protein
MILNNKESPTGEWTDVERQVIDAYKSDGIDRSNENPDELRREIRKFAYHEGGHVVARMFTGVEAMHLRSVSIIPDGTTAGRERSERNLREIFLLTTATTNENDLSRLITAYTVLLELLAGRGAEMRIAAAPELENILDPDAMWMEGTQQGTDLFRAQRIAESVARPGRPALRILRLTEKWTIEMLTVREVWCAVERLASMLLERGAIEDLGEIRDVCREALGLIYRLPEWRRRLHFKLGKRIDFRAVKVNIHDLKRH